MNHLLDDVNNLTKMKEEKRESRQPNVPLVNFRTEKNINEIEKSNLVKKANGFVLSRCMELEDLFPESVKVKDRVDRSRQHSEF